MSSQSESYKAAGVDITAGYQAVELMKRHIARTAVPGVLGGIGGFGGRFELDVTGYRHPVLVSGTDGVGTKLKLAFLLDRHDTVGIDCVAMCANDIVCSGAVPLFFLDYIATGKLVPEKIEQIVAGVAEGCVQAGCALVGGETAEMPGFYAQDEYDMAGFCVGLAEKERMPDPGKVRAGDLLLALPSSGVHSNGFSLVRSILRIESLAHAGGLDELGGSSVLDTLLVPTKIYVQPILRLTEAVEVRSLAHITGGGFYENIPRCLPHGLTARIERAALRTPPIFGLLQRAGSVCERDMFNTFNMGVGMVVAVAPGDADRAVAILKDTGEQAYVLGEVASGEEGVVLC